jgi:translation elongation factor EF-Tu-like GTPase
MFKFSVSDLYATPRGTVFTGTVDGGAIESGSPLNLLGRNTKIETVCLGVEFAPVRDFEMKPGEKIGVLVPSLPGAIARQIKSIVSA